MPIKVNETADWIVYPIFGSTTANGNDQLVHISSSPKQVYLLNYDEMTTRIML